MQNNEKKRYYVSVQADTIMNNRGDSSFEFEIDATEEDIAKLKELFEDKEDSDNRTYLRSHLLGIPYHQDEENDAYDSHLTEVYRLLYELGTESTRKIGRAHV